jgi:UrcA family protein
MTMTTSLRTKLALSIGCLCGAATLGSLPRANAADDGVPTRRVSYADLDITRTPGAKVLYHRIDVAARQVCSVDNRSDLGAFSRQHTCVQDAIDAAVRQVNATALSELHAAATIHLAASR